MGTARRTLSILALLACLALIVALAGFVVRKGARGASDQFVSKRRETWAGRDRPLALRYNFVEEPIRDGKLKNLTREALRSKLSTVKRKFWPNRPMDRPSTLMHYLHLWGDRAQFSDPTCMSGLQMLGALLDGEQHALYTGAGAFVYKTRSGEVQFRAVGGGGESHPNQCLALLAELGTPTDRVLPTVGGTLRDAIRSALLDFMLVEKPEWSIVAFGRYLPPTRRWQNRWGDRFSFDQLAAAFLDRDPGVRSPCGGTHLLYATCVLLQADEQCDILSDATRSRLIDRLQEAAQTLERTQHREGYWTLGWMNDLGRKQVVPEYQAETERTLITGHHLEWIVLAPPEAIPSRRHLGNALHWCLSELEAADPEVIHTSICDFSHCLASLYQMCLPDELVDGGFLPAD